MSNMSDEAIAAGEAALEAYFGGGHDGVVESASEKSDEPDLSVGDGPARDDKGRFASTKDEALFPTQEASGEESPAETPASPPEASETPSRTSEEEAPQPLEDAQGDESDDYVLEVDDPELLELIETKYGGDVLKALTSLKDAQSVIGRQGDELGELRAMREEFAGLKEFLAQQQYAQSINWDEAIDADPENAAMQAFETGDMNAFGRAIDAVALESPFKASVMMQAFSQLAAAPEPQQNSLETEVAALKERIPDLQQTLPAIQEELKSRPALQQALESGDPRVMSDALETAYTLAKSRSQSADTSKAARKLILKAKAETDAAIADAAVVGASTVPQVTPPKRPEENLETLLEDIFGEHVPVV